MRISKVRIWNYRSIKCCEETRLDRHVTVLIGMNESGKTNFLKALQSFSRDYTYVEDDICDYCEAKGKLEAGESTNADIAMITMCFGVDKEDKPKLKDIHERLAQAPEIALTKFYDGRYVVEVDGVDISELESEVNDCIEDLRDWPKIRALLSSS